MKHYDIITTAPLIPFEIHLVIKIIIKKRKHNHQLMKTNNKEEEKKLVLTNG